MNPAPSLAEFLRSRGHDVWVAELQGSGFSSKPGIFRSDCGMGWGFDDHLEDNMDAIISHVTSQTGRTSAHWIGHSMGGMLIEAYLGRNNSAAVASAIAIGSPVDFSNSNAHPLRHALIFEKVLRLIPFNPLIPVMKCFMPAGKLCPGVLSVLFSMNNIDWSVAKKLVAVGVEFLSSSVLWLDMARFMDEGKFLDRAGRSYFDGLDESKTPLLVIAGTKDNMAPMDSVMAIGNYRADNQVTEYVAFGKENGCLEEYGHTDLLIGKRVEKEVFPLIDNWLQRWDNPEQNRNQAKLM
jgi:pimeloyl-ACP methyl ester carboxylesterase